MMAFCRTSIVVCSLHLVLAIAVPTQAQPLPGKDNNASASLRCFVIECYRADQSPRARSAQQLVETFVKKHAGYVLRNYAVENDAVAEKRLKQLSRHFNLEQPPVLAYCSATPIVVGDNARTLERDLQHASTLTAYVRTGCPHCDRAKQLLPKLTAEYPALHVRIRDIVADNHAPEELHALARRYGTAATSVPAFHVCNQLLVGFVDDRATGSRLRTALNSWTVVCNPAKSTSSQVGAVVPTIARVPAQFTLASAPDSSPYAAGDRPDSASLGDTQLPLPGDAEMAEPGMTPDEAIDLPVFGPLRVSDIGLPLFTVAVGLVDGFNPCAMWVLLFLLSVLVNLHSRARILLVAGTFVFISAAAYFAFMAAWLSVFRFVGMLRAVQLTLAIVAIGVGLIHIKDFVAFHRGVTLSIPESAKPTIYEYVRRIVTAEHLGGVWSPPRFWRC